MHTRHPVTAFLSTKYSAGKGKGPAGQGGRVNYSLLFLLLAVCERGRRFWRKRILECKARDGGGCAHDAQTLTACPGDSSEVREGGFKRRRKGTPQKTSQSVGRLSTYSSPHLPLRASGEAGKTRESRSARTRQKPQKRVLQNSVINVEQTFIINVKEKM